MNRIKWIIQTSIFVTLIACIIFLFVFGWLFSLGLLVGGAVGILDFWMIVTTVNMMKNFGSDGKIMAKFSVIFIGKTFGLLFLLGAIVFVFARIGQILTFGFIAGLGVIPLSVIITAFRKNTDNNKNITENKK